MKKALILTLMFLCGAASAAAQDLIVKTDDSRVEAKVTEITPAEVRYKRFSNPEGPTYVLPVGDIRYIQYPNGEKEFFAKQTPDETPAAPVAAPAEIPAAEPAAPRNPALVTSQTAPLQRELKIGDFYSKDGVEGVICKLSEDGQHGLLISLDEIYLPWEAGRRADLQLVGTSDRTDGSENMRILEEYIAKNNLSWEDFPAFKWCRDKGEGWYLPSIDEMLVVGHNYNGGTRIQANRGARSKFNDALKTAGGERMNRVVFYFSSTEADIKQAFTVMMPKVVGNRNKIKGEKQMLSPLLFLYFSLI